MCHAAVANSGEHQEQRLRRRPLAADANSDGGGGGAACRGEPAAVMATTASSLAAPWQESGSRQAREMSAMVAALARVVAGSAAPPAKGPPGGAGLLAQAQAQDASMAEACWPYPYAELQPHVAEPSPPGFVLHGMSMSIAAAACLPACHTVAAGSSIAQHSILHLVHELIRMFFLFIPFSHACIAPYFIRIIFILFCSVI